MTFRSASQGFLMALLACSPRPVVTEVHLDPPPAGQGFQLVVPPYEVPAGQEIQACYFFKVPGDAGKDVWVNRYLAAQTSGSHHMNIFRVKTRRGLWGQPGDAPVVNGECENSGNWSDWPLVMNTQTSGETDWILPEGVGARFSGGELIMLQTHYVNATTQVTPGKAHVLVNFYTTPGAPRDELATLFATNQNIRICPGERGKSFVKSCKFPGEGVRIIAANGHFHSRGKRFEMNVVDQAGSVGEKFYESTSWDDPPMARDFVAVVPRGGGVMWRCTFDAPAGSCGDPADSCCFTFGGKVEHQEHCNAFVYYYPKVADVNCF